MRLLRGMVFCLSLIGAIFGVLDPKDPRAGIPAQTQAAAFVPLQVSVVSLR